ncbi:hypothetical protein FHQ26_06625 [Testudinibacter sp. TR-2022]|uniref:hypothetical protein n=1 Tax=Testudinibacter sp. TR-2022 TaxID=2585029 RepID=UPI0011195B09|nr:hypothetical protein [Testudinibacter sp. TR-2022]TNH00308.1 hypothetical protein FHQ22_12205 [Pasteurellaceae bacterium Phil31]TNH09724.1 hypothetical protein FHQ26_06625 [Testudinibacter sp. TR-2022]TNH11105.1 hypothetical protein FHQ25_03595 [Testudinibacter sp. TR-2022]TNH13401.1 hypothetical protein FIA56_07605 [Testudinibacter sp. TR-2022]TNH19493.1 hypothetical protein FHQ23_02685 [Testudinibacter sp. TR-2022]
MLRIELKESRPGYAQFSAVNWKGGSEVEVSIQRSQDHHYFAQDNQWNTEPVWHRVTQLSVVDGILQGELGPWLVDALVQQNANVQYQMMVRDTHAVDNVVTDRGVLKMVGNILASSASGDTSRVSDIRHEPITVAPTMPIIEEPEPIAVEPEVITEPPLETETEPMAVPVTETEKPKSKLGLLIGGLLLLILAAAAAWFFLLSDKSVEPTEVKPSELSACSIQAASDDEIAFLQRCLKSNPDDSQILALIAEAKKANKCGIAQRLYANKAQGGNAAIALAYAKEYETAAANSCFSADKETAIYWYETALEADPNNAEAKARLQELKK